MTHQTSSAARERSARRALDRMGYKLCKSRTQDPNDYRHGGYMIVDPNINGVVAGSHPLEFSLDLDAVEAWIEG